MNLWNRTKYKMNKKLMTRDGANSQLWLIAKQNQPQQQQHLLRTTYVVGVRYNTYRRRLHYTVTDVDLVYCISNIFCNKWDYGEASPF